MNLHLPLPEIDRESALQLAAKYFGVTDVSQARELGSNQVGLLQCSLPLRIPIGI